MTTYLKQIIDQISAKETIKKERALLKDPAVMFKLYNDLTNIFDGMDKTKAQKKKSAELLEDLKSKIEGNID